MMRSVVVSMCNSYSGALQFQRSASCQDVSENKNHAEAEYRYVLTRLRENGESIAVLGGEDEERSAINHSLTTVLRRWREICIQTMRAAIVEPRR